MKKKLYLYLLIFIMSCVYTALALPVSHALDSYCTMCHGYYDTAIWFLQNGRIFSYIFYLLFDIIKISYDTLGIISVLIGNAILSYAICILYNELKKHHKSFTKLHRSILVVALFCLFYNPLYPSILVLDEAFIIDLGILFMTIAAIQLVKNNTKGYITSLIFTVLGLACYQGIASYLPIILFILIISDKSKQNNYKFVFKRTILAIKLWNRLCEQLCNY